MNKIMVVCIIAILSFSLLFGCTESNKPGFTKQDCSNDCTKLGKQLFKYNYSMGGYGPNIVQCWCVNDKNSVEQVW